MGNLRRKLWSLRKIPVKYWKNIPWIRDYICQLKDHDPSDHKLWCIRCGKMLNDCNSDN